MLTNEQRGDHRSPRKPVKRHWGVPVSPAFLIGMALLFGTLRLVSIKPALRSVNDDTAQPIDPSKSSAPAVAGNSFRALVYLQASDCRGNLALVRPILALHEDHSPLSIVFVDVSRAPADSSIRSLLPNSMQSFPVRRITPTERKRLQHLGVTESPVVLVVDERERVRMTLTAESEPWLRVAQARAVRHLIEGDPGR